MSHQTYKKRLLGFAHRGFSLPEVLIAALILMIILAVVLESQMNSAMTIDKSKQRRTIQAKITEDLNMLRSRSDRWQCVNGTSCTGLAADQDEPMRFALNHCQQENLLENYPIEDATLEVGTNGLLIEREMTIDSLDGHINVKYTSEIADKTISANSTITPEALKWCG